MLGSPSPVRQLVLSLLALPPLFLTVSIIAGFPYPPNPPLIHPSLASLPPSCASWSLYPEDYYQGGSYVVFPHGRVSLRSTCGKQLTLTLPQTRYWLIGPVEGPRVRASQYSALTLFSQSYPTGSPHPWPVHPSHCLEGRGTSPRLPRLSCPPLR